MKYLSFLFIFFILGSLCAQTTTKDTTKIKTMKLVKSKQEFKEHFKDSNSYLILQPSTLLPQTQVWISPPKNFKPVDNIRGFIHLATTTSITCTEIKGYHYSQLSDQLTSEYIASQNAFLNATEDVVTENGMPGKLLTISFTIPAKDSLHKDTPFERLMLFTGDLERTVWLNATYPQSVKRFVSAIVRKSLLSVKLNNTDKQ
ncbi:MAG: hypothetical protein Fur0028_07810 [Bacteroidales bacterium]